MVQRKDKTGKRGAPEHFTGFKLAFLVARADSYQQALDAKATGSFYDKVTLAFIAKYGQEEPFNKEFAEDPPNLEDNFDDNEDDGDRPHPSKEEADESTELFKKLRTVSSRILCPPNYFLILKIN